MTMKETPQLLTTEEASKYLRITPKELTKKVRLGHVPAYRLPGSRTRGRLRFIQAELDAAMIPTRKEGRR